MHGFVVIWWRAVFAGDEPLYYAMPYAKGQKITCSHCSADAFVKLEAVMNGWTKTGESAVCSECNVALDDTDSSHSPDTAGLSTFLGTEKAVPVQVIDDSGKIGFCRDCVSYVEHPFAIRCMLHNRVIEPMDSCSDYAERKDDT